MTNKLLKSKISADFSSKQKNYPLCPLVVMNNAIIATVFIAMMFAMGITTTYIFTPSPAVIYKTTEGESVTDGLLNEVGNRRR